jgi:hypothetical protein
VFDRQRVRRQLYASTTCSRRQAAYAPEEKYAQVRDNAEERHQERRDDGSPDVCARCGSDMGRYIGSMAEKIDLLFNHGVTTIAVS